MGLREELRMLDIESVREQCDSFLTRIDSDDDEMRFTKQAMADDYPVFAGILTSMQERHRELNDDKWDYELEAAMIGASIALALVREIAENEALQQSL